MYWLNKTLINLKKFPFVTAVTVNVQLRNEPKPSIFPNFVFTWELFRESEVLSKWPIKLLVNESK